MKIGYARVCTDDQNLDLQMDALNKAECERISPIKGLVEPLSSVKGWPRQIAAVGNGDVLVVWKLDRLGRIIELSDRADRETERRGGRI